ncbi:MAG: PD-(D/E)XK nuclease family protein, partial [Terracidiphilus sp.]
IAASSRSGEAETLESLAASAYNVLTMPAPVNGLAPKPTRLRRLPSNYRPPQDEIQIPAGAPAIATGSLFERHEGGLVARALGIAVHELLQRFAEIRATQTDAAAQTALSSFAPRISARLRASGIDATEAGRITAQAIEIVRGTLKDPQAQWILGPHVDSASEARWTGMVTGKLRSVQVDRVFRAGATPRSSGSEDTWWIIDYKTAECRNSGKDGPELTAELSELRRIFAPQIEAYAKVLRNLHGPQAPICGGLYYPRMLLFDWWEL